MLLSRPVPRIRPLSAPDSASGAGKPGFRPDIQGLRAVAVGAVVAYHAGLPIVPGGFVGVDVFFVISGFLITGHLLTSLGSGSCSGTALSDQRVRLDFATFYARRARRILPAAIIVIVLTVIAAVIVVPPLRLGSILRDAIFAALYIPNLHFAAEQTDYLAGSDPSPFQHYWSLGVEEQFYLLWPLLLVGLVALARTQRIRRTTSDPRIALLLLVAAATVISFAACLVIAQISTSWAFFSTPTRAFELTLGATTACLATLKIRVAPVIASIGGWLGLSAIVASAVLFTTDTPYPGLPTLLPVVGTALLLWFGAHPSRRGPAMVLSIRPLQFVGLISYSLYLVHWPMLVLSQEAVGARNALPLWSTVLLGAAAVPVAWLLHRWVEKPVLARKLRDRRDGRRTLVATGIVTIALVGALTGGTVVVAAAPLDSGRTTPASPLTPDPPGTTFVPSNLNPDLLAATRDTGEIYQNGCQQNIVRSAVITCEYGTPGSDFTVALFGDSHAGRWFPALDAVATERGIGLVTYTKSRCRSEESDTLWTATIEPSCATWRADALASLAADPPDLIVLTNHIAPMPGRKQSILEERWRDVTAESIARLPRTSRVVIIADTPQYPASPVDCLSGNLASALRCAVPRDEALNRAVTLAQRAAAAEAGAGFVDLTDYLCNRASCPAIIGDTLVYSDDHHLTASFSEKLAAPLDRALEEYLP